MIIVIGLFILITFIFIIAFVAITESEIAAPLQSTSNMTADTYLDQVNRLLQDANADNGALLVEKYACIACHRLDVSNKIAPSFEGVSKRAATRRPRLTAAAYLYESIINPTIYVVAGYQPAMPQDYAERLSDQELGDIIAYLLTPAAH